MFGHAQFDIPAASIDLESQSIGPTGAHVIELFTFHGPAPGTPLTVHLRAHVHAEIAARLGSTEAGGFAWLLPSEDVPGDVVAPPTHFPPNPGALAVYDGALDLVLTREAETPVGLEVEANVFAWNDNAARATVTFEFVLPPGVSVTSCRGYVQDAPVPASPASWGVVKAAYR
jgi:hypothetical protein